MKASKESTIFKFKKYLRLFRIKPLNRVKKILLLSLLLIALLFGLKQIKFSSSYAEAQERYADLQTFTRVLNLIQQYYVEEVDTKKLLYGAIKGMLKELDPHTNFLPPDIYKDFETETSGEFGGLGIEISIQNNILTVISPIEDAPAWLAGIKAGDKIVAIDGKSVKGLSLVECSQLLKGSKGSNVILTVVREGEENTKDYVITRGQVKIKSVKMTNLEDGFYYFKITSFIENTVKDFEKHLSECLTKPNGLKGVIIDLRQNPGGLLEQAIKMSDLFLKDGLIVSTIGRDPLKKDVVSATKKGKFTTVPLIVLVNEYSASASEIFAGAMQDNKRGLIMGERTFGKGSVQSVIKLGDGSGLKLTVARYYTPSGKSIQSEGITPDILLEDVDSDGFNKAIINKTRVPREKDIVGHLLSEKEKKQKDEKTSAWWKDLNTKKETEKTKKEKLIGSDYQLFQAYNYLKAWKMMKEIKE